MFSDADCTTDATNLAIIQSATATNSNKDLEVTIDTSSGGLQNLD